MHQHLPTPLPGHGRRIKNLFAVVLALLSLSGVFITSSAWAAVPQTLNYQGFLTNKTTSAPLSVTVSVTFKLYDAVTAGTLLYTEIQPTVAVSNGVFNAQIGSVTPLSLAFDKPYWLEITVGTDTLAPRQPLASSATALRAGQSDTATTATTISGTVSGSQITGTLSNATVPGTAPWVATSAATQLAAGNTAYIATGTTLTAFTLPAAPAVGDVVKVSSPGAGGFTVVPNAGQTILTSGVVRDSVRYWQTVASSSDGTKLVATVYNGQIYTSVDSGVTWTARDSARFWFSVASSADGTKLVAVENGGQIYTSVDSGVTWTARDSARSWYSVASSADGTKLVAVVSGGQIYASLDSGVTWSARESARNWWSVASSADGTKLVALVSGGQIYTSVDSGVTWTPRDSARSWNSVASSSDGTKLVAVVYALGGQIYTSADSGVTWTARDSPRIWRSVASSADGTKLVAAASPGQIYTSTDSGVTWTARDKAQSWWSVASSADGSKLVAVVAPGQIMTWDSTLSGGQYASVELLYSGTGQWVLANQQGVGKINIAANNVTISGSISVPPPSVIDFGTGMRQMINLWAGGLYGIGIQGSTQYARVDGAITSGGFAWYKGGAHSNATFDSGGGTTLMTLDQAGNLNISGTLRQTIFGTGTNNTAYGAQALPANTTGSNNSAFGSNALQRTTAGIYNTAMGAGALNANVSGNQNTAVGVSALQSNTGSNNIGLGFQAGINLTTGNFNIDIGNAGVAAEGNTIRIGDTNQARAFISGIRAVTTGNNDAQPVVIDSAGQLGSVTCAAGQVLQFDGTKWVCVTGFDVIPGTGTNNTAYGAQALLANTTGFNNTAIGVTSLQANQTGNWNTAVGVGSLNHNISGTANAAFGTNALAGTTTGNGNVAVGDGSASNSANGSNNTAIGQFTLSANSTGSSNIAVGYQAGSAVTGSNNISIGNVGVVGESGIIRLGAAGTHTATYIAGVLYTPSDRNLKDNFAPVDDLEFLNKVVSLPLLHWSYKNDAQHVLHVGPMAQDFYAAFKVGADERNIATIDEGGVALAAIKGLNQKLERLVKVQAVKIVELEKKSARVAQLEQDRADLAARMEALEQQSAEIAELQRTVKLLLSRDRLNETVALRH
jgi:hypothetical protein